LESREIELDDLDAVRQDSRNRVTLANPGSSQAVNDLIDPPEQFARSVLGAVGRYECQMIGIGLRQCPEAEVGHNSPPIFAPV
jgi:hypothetical protein